MMADPAQVGAALDQFRRRAALGSVGDLPAAQIHHLRARWLALKVRGAVGLVDRIVGGETQPNVATPTHSRDNP